MATLNVGAMAARLGLDPSEFLDKMKGVQGFNGFVSGEMSRQWKKTGRDGQEGLRLIDEALGIHVARPVARIVSETFPSLGKAMSAILPGVAFSALGIAIFEFAEGIAKKMDEAKKKQDEYTDAVLHTKAVMADAAGESQKTFYGLKAKEAALGGDVQGEAKYKALAANADAAEKMAKFVDALVGAERRELSASLALMPVWEELGSIWHTIWTSDAKLGMEAVGAEIDTFNRKFRELSSEDALKGTNAAAQYLNQQLKESQDKIDDLIVKQTAALANAKDSGALIGTEGFVPAEVAGPSDEQVNAEKSHHKKLQEIKDQADRDAENARLKAKNDATEAGKRHADELRSELQQIQRLGDTSKAAADSALLLAEATGKGTAASILAAAAAESEKKILDARAEAKSKLFGDTHQPLSGNKQVQDALAAYAVTERQSALTNQAAKAVEEFNRKLGEQSTHDDERIAALHAEAEGHGKVAGEQAKELATLIPLRENLEQLKQLRASVPAGTPLAASLDTQIGKGEAGLKAETDKKTNIVLPAIQASAFNEEIKKVKERTAELAGAVVSPWAKIDAEVKTLTADLKLAPDQVAILKQALTGLQNTKISEQFSKLADKLEQAQAATKELGSGSPFAKLSAEAVKIGQEFGLDAAKIDKVRQELIKIQATENAGKAYGAVSDLSAGGAKMQELKDQMTALRALSQPGAVGLDGAQPDLAAIKLEMQAITAEEDAILLKTGGISTGFKAWADDMQRVKSEGEATFEFLKAATTGFEDSMAKTWLDILEMQRKAGETTRQEHKRMIRELELLWSNYFNNLAQLALKHGIEKLLAPVGKAIASKIPALGGVFGGGKDAATVANTTALGLNTAADTANTAALVALTTAVTAAAASSAGSAAGAAAGAAGGASGGGGTGGNAAGTDFWRGGPTWVGEQGPEIINLPRGSQVTPNDVAMRGGGTTVTNHYDQRGAVVTDDLMRKGDAARMVAASKTQAIQEAVLARNDLARRSLSR